MGIAQTPWKPGDGGRKGGRRIERERKKATICVIGTTLGKSCNDGRTDSNVKIMRFGALDFGDFFIVAAAAAEQKIV